MQTRLCVAGLVMRVITVKYNLGLERSLERDFDRLKKVHYPRL